MVWCESPQLSAGAATPVQGELRIAGWAVSPAGIESVTVDVEGHGRFTADIGGRRPDVHKAFYPAEWARRPGFELTIPTAAWLPGVCEVTVSARDARGSSTSASGRIEWLPSLGELAADFKTGRPALWVGEPRCDMSDPLAETVSVRGWVSARGGVESVVVELEGLDPARAFVGDVAFEPEDDVPKSAFAIVLEAAGLGSGPRALTVDAVARGGASTRRSGKLLIDPAKRYRDRLANQRGHHAGSPEGRPAESVKLRVWVTEGEPGAALRDALDAQDHPPAAVTNVEEGLDEALASLLESSHRVAVFVAAGDWLDGCALAAIAARFEAATPPDLVYSDHDSRDANGLRSDPVHKPGWSPELLLSVPYVGSFVAVGPRAAEAALRRSGGRLNSVHALLLALVDEPLRVGRIPEVLWSRQVRDFHEVSEREDAALAQVAAGRGVRISVKRRDQRAGVRDVDWALEGQPSVSVVIPTTGRESPLSACLRSLMDRTTYPDLEVVLVDSGGEAGATAESVGLAHRVVPYEAAEFNFSGACNLGAEAASGEYIAFVNDDVEALDGEWLARMVAQAQLPATGAVGAKLLYPNALVQHAGLVLDRLSGSSGADFVAAQFAFHQESEDPAHLMNLPRDCSAVTGACLVMRADVLDDLGGWDEGFRIDFGDVDLCLRAIEAGRRVIVEPRARLLHREHATQGDNPHDEDDGRRFRGRWSTAYAEGDPWYHPACAFGRDWEVR